MDLTLTSISLPPASPAYRGFLSGRSTSSDASVCVDRASVKSVSAADLQDWATDIVEVAAERPKGFSHSMQWESKVEEGKKGSATPTDPLRSSRAGRQTESSLGAAWHDYAMHASTASGLRKEVRSGEKEGRKQASWNFSSARPPARCVPSTPSVFRCRNSTVSHLMYVLTPSSR